ncbi:MAG: ATP-dependent 6-phosphofructokinase [Myxococcales bacterium]
MRIGVMTGGGDCAGLNAVIRAVVKTAHFEFHDDVVGLEDGFDALVRGDLPLPLTPREVRGILGLGGTILGTTNRGNPFQYLEPGRPGRVDRSGDVVEQLEALGIDGLVLIGGDGTMSIGAELTRLGVPIVGVPKTIDNDLVGTDQTFGFDSALGVAMDALDRLRTTAESHERVMILEVMGRYAGWIALHAGIAGGAHAILIPEIPYDPKLLVRCIRRRFAQEGKYFLIVVAEGARPQDGSLAVLAAGVDGTPERLGGAGERLARQIEENIHPEIRVTVLGHLQRGGSPSPLDRILATRFGCEAVHMVHRGEFGRLVVLRGEHLESVPLEEVAGKQRLVDPGSQLILTARSLGVCFGDGVGPG